MNIEKTLKSNSKGLKNNHMQKKVNNAVRKINAFPELVKNFSSHVSKLKQAHSKHLHMIKSLSKFNSAFTFQQSIPEISFSKADRFLNPSPKDQISSLLLLPSTLISKNYNLGYGTKYYFPKHIIINALENPSPSAYITHADLTKSTLQNITKGRSFGISHKYYQKNFLPHCKTQNLEQNKHFPGPGKYNLDREIGDLSIANKRRVNLRIKGKIGNFIDDEIKNDQSPKKYYYPNTDSTKNLRYSSVGFGMGEKFDFTNTPVAENPGPGQYEVKGMGKKKGRKIARRIIIGGNWKSHNTLKDSQNLVNNVINNLKFDPAKLEVVIAPVFLHVPWVLENVRKDVQVSAQNCSATPFGQFTGEIAAQHIKDFGLNWTIVGHSERRKFYGETDAIVADKTRIALDNGLQVIACIGEKLEERESNETMIVIERQLKAITDKLKKDDWKNVVLAYEPVWAIGTGKVASPEQAQEVHAFIRKFLRDEVSAEVSEQTRIMYGGSVNEKNSESLIKQLDVDGFLVGGASLKAEFAGIVDHCMASLKL